MDILHEFFDKDGNLSARVVSIESCTYLMYNNCDDMLEVEYSGDKIIFPEIGMSVDIDYLSSSKVRTVLTARAKRALMGISNEYGIPLEYLKHLYHFRWVYSPPK